jgi:NTP pyrophosphatase (non-canonical NTP hydrolase)
MSDLDTELQPYRDFVDFLFQSKREGADGFLHAGAGLAFEAGEVGDHMKKHWVYDRPLPRDEVIEEMGDTCHYFVMLLIKMNVSLSEVIEGNVEKLSARYPNGFTKHDAIARADKGPTTLGSTRLQTKFRPA